MKKKITIISTLIILLAISSATLLYINSNKGEEISEAASNIEALPVVVDTKVSNNIEAAIEIPTVPETVKVVSVVKTEDTTEVEEVEVINVPTMPTAIPTKAPELKEENPKITDAPDVKEKTEKSSKAEEKTEPTKVVENIETATPTPTPTPVVPTPTKTPVKETIVDSVEIYGIDIKGAKEFSTDVNSAWGGYDDDLYELTDVLKPMLDDGSNGFFVGSSKLSMNWIGGEASSLELRRSEEDNTFYLTIKVSLKLGIDDNTVNINRNVLKAMLLKVSNDEVLYDAILDDWEYTEKWGINTSSYTIINDVKVKYDGNGTYIIKKA